MENVEIKKEEEKKPAKKPAVKKDKLSTRQLFMHQCNERRAKAGLEPAYSEEAIKSAK